MMRGCIQGKACVKSVHATVSDWDNEKGEISPYEYGQGELD